MFIAHLPAGYLLTGCFPRRRGVMLVGLIASVIPDLDLLYFFFFDGRRNPHHDYWTHVPLFWLACVGIAALLLVVLRRRDLFVYLWVVLANVMLHLVLDSVAAEIRWFYPLNDWRFNLVTVPAVYRWWVWNFVLHWTFLLEVMIIMAALIVWMRDAKKHTHSR